MSKICNDKKKLRAAGYAINGIALMAAEEHGDEATIDALFMVAFAAARGRGYTNEEVDELVTKNRDFIDRAKKELEESK